MLEGAARIWLRILATPEQFQQYSLYTQVAAEKFQWSPHPYLNYYPTPNYESELTRHNSLGYRGEEFPLEKPAGEFRIVALGGSTTYTIHVQDNALTFTAQLEEILQQTYGYAQARVINAGAAGYTSWESLANLQFRVLALDPDLVIVYHGTNDVHARIVAPENYHPDNTGKVKAWSPPPIPWFERSAALRIAARQLGFSRQVALGDFVNAETLAAIRFISRSYSDPQDLEVENFPMRLLQHNPPIYFERNLRNMVAIAQEHAVAILLASWAHSPHFQDYAATPLYRQAFQENNQVVQQVAVQTGAHYFDFAAQMPQQSEFWADGRHVNEAGARRKAELFAAFLHENGLID